MSPEDAAKELADIAGWIREAGPAVLGAKHLPPVVTPAGRVTGGDVADPTGNAAAAVADDWLLQQQAEIRHGLQALLSWGRQVQGHLNEVWTRLAPEQRGPDRRRCTGNPKCPGAPRSPNGGPCEPCGRWLARHPDATQVPDDLIRARLERTVS